MRSFFLSAVLTLGLGVLPSQGQNAQKEEFSFENRPDKESRGSRLWLWPAGHKENAAPQRSGEFAEFSPNHAWMVLTQRIDQNADTSDRDYHLHIARRVNDSVYRYEPQIDAEFENKVLSLVLALYGYRRSDCQRYSMFPCPQCTADSQSVAVMARIQVTDRKDKEFFETIADWKGLYNLEKGEVFQVLDTGKVSAASSDTAPTFIEIRSNGEEAQTLWQWQGNRKQEAEQIESSFEVSFDNSWLVINGHISTGGYLEFAREKDQEIYTLAGGVGDSNDGGVAALAFKQNGLNAHDYMGDHFSYSFKGWDNAPNRMIVGFDSRLSVKDKDGNFLHLTGWSGVYDLNEQRVVDELTSGTADAFVGERFPQTRQRLLTRTEGENWSYAQLRYAINETYARHGATFHDQAIAKQFQQFVWYKPHPERSMEQIEDSFSDQEKKNIELLKELMDAKQTH